MAIPISDAYKQLLRARGTVAPSATSGESLFPVDSYSAFPKEVLELLAVQDGEDPFKALSLGFRFIGAQEIAETMANLREMVEDDETLPPAFLEFVPFLHTGVKTDVGVFTGRSGFVPGRVVEYHYETGEFVVWASNIETFLEGLLSSDSSLARVGFEFPCSGMSVVDLERAIPWQPG